MFVWVTANDHDVNVFMNNAGMQQSFNIRTLNAPVYTVLHSEGRHGDPERHFWFCVYPFAIAHIEVAITATFFCNRYKFWSRAKNFKDSATIRNKSWTKEALQGIYKNYSEYIESMILIITTDCECRKSLFAVNNT